MEKGVVMERRAWTARGTMQEEDEAVIAALVDKNKVAARIFVTGEVHESYIGDAAVRLLVNINDTLYTNGVAKEPLFIETREDTVRMTRFDPAVVWRYFNPDTLTDLIKAEVDRLGVEMDPWTMEQFDFYESMVAAMEAEKTELAVPNLKKDADLDWFYNSVYLASLLLFHKPGYMDIPVAQHFSNPVAVKHLKGLEYRLLMPNERKAVAKLREQYKDIQALTNPELNFVVGLFEKGEV